MFFFLLGASAEMQKILTITGTVNFLLQRQSRSNVSLLHLQRWPILRKKYVDSTKKAID